MSEALSILTSTAVAALIGGLAGWITFRGPPDRSDAGGPTGRSITELH